MSNPLISNTRLFYYLMVWALIFCAHLFILFFVFELPLLESSLDSFLFNGFFCFFGLGLWYMVRYYNIEKKTFFSVILSHLSASLIISSLWILFPYIILRFISGSVEYLSFLNSSIPWRYFIGLFYYSFTTLIYYVVLFYGQYQEKKIREASLIIETQESELKRLRSQINPHFIFNTLNSISSLTLIAPEKAQEMVVKLSEFLRYSLKHDAQKQVTFKEELDNIKLYLDIEKTRFGNRFFYTEAIEPACFNNSIPDMILQPLFENALKHGVYESLDSVTIQLTSTCDTGFLHVKIGNSFSGGGKMKKGTGTGLTNIKNRLRLIYGRSDLLKVTPAGDFFEVLVSIPQKQGLNEI
ncbi:MAG: histidine kinase [Bacteroidota bacterium]|nr:histidine kinase [Bacteroidota bacterium]